MRLSGLLWTPATGSSTARMKARVTTESEEARSNSTRRRKREVGRWKRWCCCSTIEAVLSLCFYFFCFFDVRKSTLKDNFLTIFTALKRILGFLMLQLLSSLLNCDTFWRQLYAWEWTMRGNWSADQTIICVNKKSSKFWSLRSSPNKLIMLSLNYVIDCTK